MRILHSIRSADPAGGGPIEGLKQLAKANQMEGHSVEVVTLDKPEDPWIAGFPIPIYALGPSYLGYGYTSRLVPWLQENRRNYDIVVVNGVWQYNAFGVWRALHETPTPYCVFTHGMLDPWFKKTYPLKHLKKWLYWPWAEYRVLRDALAVLFTCEEERRLARRSFWLYRCDEIVVNYGTAGPPADSPIAGDLFLEKFPRLQNKRLILFLGRIHVKKGCDLLIEAFAQMVATGEISDPSLHLVMAGPDDNEFAQEVKNIARDLGIEHRVTWTGMLMRDLKWSAFRASEVFILPSHQENFGIAVAEALACKIPVLISDKVNIWREIQQDRAGLVEDDSLDGTMRLLRGWLQMSATEKDRMRQDALDCFETRFSIEKSAKSFIKALELSGLSV